MCCHFSYYFIGDHQFEAVEVIIFRHGGTEGKCLMFCGKQQFSAFSIFVFGVMFRVLSPWLTIMVVMMMMMVTTTTARNFYDLCIEQVNRKTHMERNNLQS
jgi:hypothetical protein